MVAFVMLVFHPGKIVSGLTTKVKMSVVLLFPAVSLNMIFHPISWLAVLVACRERLALKSGPLMVSLDTFLNVPESFQETRYCDNEVSSPRVMLSVMFWFCSGDVVVLLVMFVLQFGTMVLFFLTTKLKVSVMLTFPDVSLNMIFHPISLSATLVIWRDRFALKVVPEIESLDTF